ncbi:MAG: hypothetical protein HC925_03005, partial [Coleofasciculaceae cyanobacterium SM2_3_26]|nr:hypothetical protein [Coleofasciculaceae cyanobacterium SM2_3_26]
MDNKRWEAAREAIARAQQVWDKWRKGREDWLQQLAYQQALAEQTPSEILPATSAYGQKVYAALQETARTAADCEEPCALRQHLARVEQQMERYFHGKAELDRCMDLLARSH